MVVSVKPIHLILDRLDHVRPQGSGFRAKCPAHGGKSRGSLSISEGDDGRVLLTCWGGCDIYEVLGAIGLSVTDLFPERIDHDTSPEQRRRMRELARASRLKSAARELDLEATILLMGMRIIRDGIELASSDATRIDSALEAIHRIREGLANV